MKFFGPGDEDSAFNFGSIGNGDQKLSAGGFSGELALEGNLEHPEVSKCNVSVNVSWAISHPGLLYERVQPIHFLRESFFKLGLRVGKQCGIRHVANSG